MLDVLVASNASRFVRPRWVSGSLLLHTLAFAVVFQATRVHAKVAQVAVADTTLLFFPRLAPPAVRPVEAHRPAGGIGGGGGTGGIILSANPPPRGFQTVLAPSEIPSAIPPVDLEQRALDPRDFSGRGVEGGAARGVVGGTGTFDPAEVLPESGGEPVPETLADARFEPAELLSQPTPRFPPALLAVGVSGRVVIQFVVDTVGQVEPPSITVLESTHPGFEASARESVAGAVFRPAHLGAYPVRQLTRQPVRFVIAAR